MMTRSIVGRFLILAVLLVSLGVIAQAALIITRGPSKSAAQARTAPAIPAVAVASASAGPQTAAATPEAVPAAAPAVQSAPQPSTAQQSTAQQSITAQQPVAAAQADAAPVRVVYPGPLGDTAMPPRKFAAAAPTATSAPSTTTSAAPSSAVQPAAPAPVAAAAPALAAPARPAPVVPVVVASADADTQPTAEPPAGGKGGVNLNSASVEALNRLGGGHIGQAIVKHRPYGSVEDLVKRRVVRRSVYEQIKAQVAAQ